ncbi:MAG: phosphoribosylaminoimidazolesuccinocarboxamide synthase [Phycisphaerales bacterium JB040]
MSVQPAAEIASLVSQLPHALRAYRFPDSVAGRLGPVHSGKVRESASVSGRSERLIVTTDRTSCFDIVVGATPHKGAVLTGLSAWWFERTRDIIGNHLLGVIDPNVMVVRACEPIKMELVVRGYITGVTGTSMWHAYSAGERVFCGITLPEGLRKNERLPEPVITPSTKESGAMAHDRSVPPEELVAHAGIDPAVYRKAADAAMAIFTRGQELAREAGLILVDTKYEFGTTPEGEVILIDEVHTPDSSRYWKADAYDAAFEAGAEQAYYDKEHVRLELKRLGLTEFGQDEEREKLPPELFAEAGRRYLEVCERLTGRALAVEPGDPTARIDAAIEGYLGRA